MRHIAEYVEEVKLHRVVSMRRLHNARGQPASQQSSGLKASRAAPSARRKRREMGFARRHDVADDARSE
jgi:hypothetical protein